MYHMDFKGILAYYYYQRKYLHEPLSDKKCDYSYRLLFAQPVIEIGGVKFSNN